MLSQLELLETGHEINQKANIKIRFKIIKKFLKLLLFFLPVEYLSINGINALNWAWVIFSTGVGIPSMTKGGISCLEVRNGYLVFCFQNCSDLLWEKNVLLIEKNF